MPIFTPFATVLWDFINRAMPLQRPGTLKPDEVYALTAFLLYKNDVIQENDVIDAQTLLKVKCPIATALYRLTFPHISRTCRDLSRLRQNPHLGRSRLGAVAVPRISERADKEGEPCTRNPQRDLFAPILRSDALMGPFLLTARLFYPWDLHFLH